MALSLPLSTEKLIQLGEVLCQHFPEMNLAEITQQIERDASDLTTPIRRTALQNATKFS